MSKPELFVWCDLETTGLDPKTHSILESAWEVTDTQLKVLWSSHCVYTYDGARRHLSEFVQDMHTKNNLWHECLLSVDTLQLHLYDEVLPKLKSFAENNTLYLSGNSVHFDRSFLYEHAPLVLSPLSHRHLDISALKVSHETRGGEKFPKQEAHRAVVDIKASQAEYKYYLNTYPLAYMTPRVAAVQVDLSQLQQDLGKSNE